MNDTTYTAKRTTSQMANDEDEGCPTWGRILLVIAFIGMCATLVFVGFDINAAFETREARKAICTVKVLVDNAFVGNQYAIRSCTAATYEICRTLVETVENREARLDELRKESRALRHGRKHAP